ncbi:MAG: class I SAM-dependent methyltransferase [Lachnospiraceae bacterium]|nr:class I SAM-dependent methyltransferase [Lachnospiraceae bacterium]
MTELEEYYNKFNEEKRFNSRHGQVEYRVSMKYIHKYLDEAAVRLKVAAGSDCKMDDAVRSRIKIVDIGAGTGRYSVALAEEGYDVTAVELVRYNLGILKKKAGSVKAMQGNALNLKKLADDSFDVTLLFGPMYHLFGFEDKRQALREAKRVTKPGGVILVAYCMNEYSVITYGFKERHVLECMEQKRFTEDFQTISTPSELYDYMRMEEINALNEAEGLERIQIISPDGPANYIRPFLNQLSEEEFEAFVRYQMAVCERADLIGAGAHTTDILRKIK